MTGPRIVYDDATVLPSVGTFCTAEEGRTRQEDAGAADLMGILRRVSDGVLPASRGPGYFGDVSDIGDFRQAQEQVMRGEAAFMSLDADVRSAFKNDPALFIEAFQSEDGIAQLRRLKVIPETEETLADRREAAAENRAARRALERERAARIREAEAAKPPAKS